MFCTMLYVPDRPLDWLCGIISRFVIHLRCTGVVGGMTINVSQPVGECHNGTRRTAYSVEFLRKPDGAAAVRMRETVTIENLEAMSRLLEAVARDRDVAAFEVLFRHYGPRVKTYMARQVKSTQIAEELMQETMMAVWNKAALYDPGRGNVSAWIFTIARNLCISTFRKQNRPEFDPNDPAFVPDDAVSADVELQTRQEADLLHAAMNDLPPEQMELIRRSFFGEVPHSALAQEFGLPLGTVKSRIRMAVAKLRKRLEERS